MDGRVVGRDGAALMIHVIETGRALPLVWLGDGACDGTRLQHTLQQAGWSYACRTAMSTVATWEGETFRLETLGACLKPGRLIEFKEVHVTREAYGPIMVRCCWAKG